MYHLLADHIVSVAGIHKLVSLVHRLCAILTVSACNQTEGGARVGLVICLCIADCSVQRRRTTPRNVVEGDFVPFIHVPAARARNIS